jgi:nitroreductase
MGLMAHQMGGFDASLTREKFNIPEQYTPMAMVSVGYPADISTLSGDTLARETAARKRKPLSEVFFDSSWGQGVKDVI